MRQAKRPLLALENPDIDFSTSNFAHNFQKVPASKVCKHLEGFLPQLAACLTLHSSSSEATYERETLHGDFEDIDIPQRRQRLSTNVSSLNLQNLIGDCRMVFSLGFLESKLLMNRSFQSIMKKVRPFSKEERL